MKIYEIFNITTLSKALGIDYYRVNRIVKGNSINGFKTNERKAIKEYIDIESEKCKQEIDGL